MSMDDIQHITNCLNGGYWVKSYSETYKEWATFRLGDNGQIFGRNSSNNNCWYNVNKPSWYSAVKTNEEIIEFIAKGKWCII